MDEDSNWAASSYVCIWIGGRPVVPGPVCALSCTFSLTLLQKSPGFDWTPWDLSLPCRTLAPLCSGIFENYLCQG